MTASFSYAFQCRFLDDGQDFQFELLFMIWVSNVLIFALIYWEYDRGGPADRAAGAQDTPDLLFPQMTDEHLAHDWEPTFFDYLFVSFTCASAFSPTDTMPLSRWCKALFTTESAVALLTITMVTARAVNILPGG